MAQVGQHPAHTHEMAHSLGDDIARCVHCGFCLQACPTYLELGMETDSPRGRIALIDALSSGRAEPTPSLLKHLDQCLQCRACETACPSGVPYGRIMETARAEIIESPQRPLSWRLRVTALRQVLPHQRRIAALMSAMRAYERSRLRRMAQRSGVLRRISASLADAEGSMPHVPDGRYRPGAQPEGLEKSVALLTGCVMPHLYARTHEATVRVLNRLGYRVIVSPSQTCCGALNVHAGDRRFARELAKRNIDAMLDAGIDAIIVNSAGCGSTMKEYGELLADDAEYAARAVRFASLTKDVLEFVAEHDLGPLGAVPRSVTYQDSCHLVHAQRVATAPRAIMSRIPALELRELASPDRCCGSAGLYSLVQGGLSRRLLAAKMDDVQQTGATTVATANPGCVMQLEAGFRARGIDGDVVHVIELLDESMRAAGR
jgi:glycolate oxidase iron-sulfur subunit